MNKKYGQINALKLQSYTILQSQIYVVTSIQNSRLNSRRRTMCLTASCSTRVHYQFNSWPYDLPWMHPFWERQRQQRFEFPNYYYQRLPEKPVWDFAPFANGICSLTDPFGDPLALNIDKTGHFIKMINAQFNQYFEQGLLLAFLKSPVRIMSTCFLQYVPRLFQQNLRELQFPWKEQ